MYEYDRASIGGTLPGDNYKDIKFKLNSINDPVAGLGGVQAPLHDNYTALYGAYIVNSVTMVIRSENYSTVPIQVGAIAMFDRTTNTPTFPSSPSTYMISNLNSTHRSPLKMCAAITSGNGQVKVVKKRFYPAAIVGRNYYTSVNFTGDSGSDPSKIVEAQILWLPQSTGTEAWGLWYKIDLIYDVTLFNPNALEVADQD